ncbi:VOC family protein [Hamadaea tsunoensis]|uniref:VOC family protein n=1 Tax=Hamadaea tsunoensis TaxID=53368 RepID=UPI000406CFEA|nr:VOC family protein [Hamadaea tsunoensis]
MANYPRIYPRVIADDFAATVRFYTETLGLAAEKVVPQFEYASFDFDGETGLAILGRAALGAAVATEPGRGAGMMLVLVVPDVDGLVARLPAEVVVAPPADRPGWNLRSAYVRDPEGNLVEIQTY